MTLVSHGPYSLSLSIDNKPVTLGKTDSNAVMTTVRVQGVSFSPESTWTMSWTDSSDSHAAASLAFNLQDVRMQGYSATGNFHDSPSGVATLKLTRTALSSFPSGTLPDSSSLGVCYFFITLVSALPSSLFPTLGDVEKAKQQPEPAPATLSPVQKKQALAKKKSTASQSGAKAAGVAAKSKATAVAKPPSPEAKANAGSKPTFYRSGQIVDPPKQNVKPPIVAKGRTSSAPAQLVSTLSPVAEELSSPAGAAPSVAGPAPKQGSPVARFAPYHVGPPAVSTGHARHLSMGAASSAIHRINFGSASLLPPPPPVPDLRLASLLSQATATRQRLEKELGREEEQLRYFQQESTRLVTLLTPVEQMRHWDSRLRPSLASPDRSPSVILSPRNRIYLALKKEEAKRLNWIQTRQAMADDLSDVLAPLFQSAQLEA